MPLQPSSRSPRVACTRWVLLAALVTFVSPLAASDARAWTIEQAVRRALSRAPELRASQAAGQEANARLEQARASAWPQATTEVGYLPHWPKNEIRLPAAAGASALPAVDDIHRFQAGVKLRYGVLDLARGPRVDAASALVDRALADEQQAAARLAYQVRAVFLGALHARDVVQIAAETLTQAEREQRRAQLRLDAGVGTQVSLAQARVRRADLAAQLARARVSLRSRREVLANLLGVRDLPQIEGDLRRQAGLVAGPAAPDAAVELGHATIDRVPALRVIDAGRRAAELSARSAVLGWVPTLSLLAGAGWIYPRALRLELGPYLDAGVVLSWTLFDGFLRGGRARQSQARADRLRQQRLAVRGELERRVIELSAQYDRARADLTAAEISLRENEIYLRVARASLAAGTGTELDVHQAELNLDRARMAVQQSLLDAALVRAERWFLQGLSSLPEAGGQS